MAQVGLFKQSTRCISPYGLLVILIIGLTTFCDNQSSAEAINFGTVKFLKPEEHHFIASTIPIGVVVVLAMPVKNYVAI